ncbi:MULTISPECIES: thioredoxin fold domain-containing protein [Acidithiobacillaceae]|uniref:Thioredoxin fold domain-containing protein n=1 Tax=Igneacidithiobacillus copahuensis TaxID=2724909 RepID=A0AAE2YNE7_9PROT|nr:MULTISPECIES: thioredoxin fold domain-containing protein [Acidithiobacillaceae]MBU2763376.1 thioredoxin fold domain-containing protein [Acidithiobacillus caldus]MBU2771215.1 thioredoxin fold domain-containing protein [Acidithiobacillus caldus]MBU2787239.1 thioredoxin fold domain-containing protein [Igneacidithiobacillus copahuensis]MBU2797893.1 thioredoxin fold domain-containing protein [Acidithiobacillus sp. VAN18-2]
MRKFCLFSRFETKALFAPLFLMSILFPVATMGATQIPNAHEEIDASSHLTPKAMPPEIIAQKIKHADTFLVGHHGPVLMAFMDPNCIWCHRFYEAAMPLVEAGKIHLRVALVGFLKPTSAAKAAAILASKLPARALAFDESHFNVATEEGGIPPDNHAPTSIRKAVSYNTWLLIHTGEEATPTLLYFTKDK